MPRAETSVAIRILSVITSYSIHYTKLYDLFLVFFLSPFLKIKKTKKAQKPGESKQSGFSVLGKIREALKEAAREMEAQVEQARKKELSGQNKRTREPKRSPFDQAGEESINQTFWDEIDDRADSDFYPDGAKVQVLEQIRNNFV